MAELADNLWSGTADAAADWRPTGQHSGWRQGVSLIERRNLSRAHADVGGDPDLANLRLARWRSQPPFDVDSCFAQRLHTSGMAEGEFRRVLGLGGTALDEHVDSAPWLATIAAAYGGAMAAPGCSTLPDALQRSRLSGFLTIVAPLIDAGCDRLRREARTLVRPASGCPFDPGASDALMLETLPGALLRMLGRTLVLELNAQRLDGALSGATPEARFESFVAGLGQPRQALEVLRAYPVLGRLAVGCIDNWVTNSLEFLHDLATDWEDIRATFCGGDDPGPLAAVVGNLGDRHRGGRAVLRARFTSGCQVVYKPRSLAVDVHFQQLLAWLNDRGARPAFRTLAIVDRRDHGWVELVHRNSCTSTAEVERFYQRHGGYLAVLYSLEATDFHCENVMASGEHPVLLDLEGLFHPRIGAAAGGSAAPAGEALAQSVMRVGLLPERIWSDGSQDGIDISGIGASGGQLSADVVPQWDSLGTDTMRFTRKRVAVPEGVNRPLLDGVEVDTIRARRCSRRRLHPYLSAPASSPGRPPGRRRAAVMLRHRRSAGDRPSDAHLRQDARGQLPSRPPPRCARPRALPRSPLGRHRHLSRTSRARFRPSTRP